MKQVVWILAVAAWAGSSGPSSLADEILELSIVGTSIRYDPVGLPSVLEGVLFYRGGARDGAVAGTYREELRPTLDPQLGMIGTTGRAVLRLVGRRAGQISIEEITTNNSSRIVGEVPSTGALLVESVGAVARGTGRFEGAAGALTSRSTVSLATPFRLETNVRLVVGASGPAPPAPRLPDRLELTRLDDGAFALRYSPAAKAQLVARLVGPDAVPPAALSLETGIAEVVLSRWLGEAKQLAVMKQRMKDLAASGGTPVPAIAIEDRLGVIVRAAVLDEDELDRFLAARKLTRADLERWHDDIVAALEVADTETNEPAARLRELRARLEKLRTGGF